MKRGKDDESPAIEWPVNLGIEFERAEICHME